MTITLNDLEFLQSNAGTRLLEDLANRDLNQSRILSLVTELRETYPQTQVHAAITMAQLQQKASTKFGEFANQLFFTEDALQQASDPQIRDYRAIDCEGLRILDVCCGTGSDSIAFAQAGAIVSAIDLDETRIAIARHNAAVLGLDIDFRHADATQITDSQQYDMIFYDPARRTAEGKRIYDVTQYIPPLSLLQTWTAPRIMAKISPGVDLQQLETYNASVEFISVNGDLKEAVLHKPHTIPFRATRIDETGIYQWDNLGQTVTTRIAEPSGWLCEPDPAILRANLVEHVTQDLDGTMLDPMIAYFCTDHQPESVWVRSWRIREWLPFNLKKLRARLREMDAGILTVKKRGSPITPEDLIRKLKLKGTQSVTIILTRYQDAPIAIICDDILAG